MEERAQKQIHTDMVPQQSDMHRQKKKKKNLNLNLRAIQKLIQSDSKRVISLNVKSETFSKVP